MLYYVSDMLDCIWDVVHPTKKTLKEEVDITANLITASKSKGLVGLGWANKTIPVGTLIKFSFPGETGVYKVTQLVDKRNVRPEAVLPVLQHVSGSFIINTDEDSSTTDLRDISYYMKYYKDRDAFDLEATIVGHENPTREEMPPLETPGTVEGGMVEETERDGKTVTVEFQKPVPVDELAEWMKERVVENMELVDVEESSPEENVLDVAVPSVIDFIVKFDDPNMINPPETVDIGDVETEGEAEDDATTWKVRGSIYDIQAHLVSWQNGVAEYTIEF